MSYSTGFSNAFGSRVTPWVWRLILANVGIFVVTSLVPGLIPYLQFNPSQILPRIWTPFTYMFVHGGLFHVLFNMLALFFFGPPLEERWGSREFLQFFLICGLGGALLSMLTPYPIIGASGAILGVMVAFAMYWPDNPIYFWGIIPVKAKWLVAFMVGLDFYYAVTGGPSGIAYLAHLGGAFTAVGYLKSPWAPPAWGELPKKARRPGDQSWKARLGGLVKRSGQGMGSTPTVSLNARVQRSRAGDDVDRLLEKISREGLASLTPEERIRLEEASHRFRTN
ncbi:MAG: rhomboid family intramembrane serine protease [Gemmatimonadota bacterium]|jgi:membrane associated rhomboid family serine protease|nr:rhomboid family intramembrane serine protease [Gemmatimonadota bacterium]